MYTDSALKNTNNLPALYKNLKPESVLFQFTKKRFFVKDWISYLRYVEMPAENNSTQDYKMRMHDFIRSACNNYYKEHIEDFYPTASEQIKEFNEANMLFYIMDKHVWTKASEDTTGLKKYYDAHKSSYIWKESVTALIISTQDKNLADSIAIKIKNAPEDWRNITASYNNVYADSSRFEIDQLPVKQQIPLQKGFQTTPENNDAGDSYTFVHVLEVYNQPQQKSFDEAKGIAINDYQQELEQAWVIELKKKYPIKINSAVFNSLH